MKKIAMIIAASGLLLGTSQAFANELDNTLATIIRSGKLDQINVYAAQHPDQQSELALDLLKIAQQDAATSPAVEAKLLSLATAFVPQIDAGNAAAAAADIRELTSLAVTQGQQSDNLPSVFDILTATLAMSGQANITAADPGLHADTLGVANQFLEENPGDLGTKLQDEISLAQQTGVAPLNSLRGGIIPSAE